MKKVCGCGNKTILAKGIKFTPEDKFAEYKRKAKIEDYKSRGLI